MSFGQVGLRKSVDAGRSKLKKLGDDGLLPALRIAQGPGCSETWRSCDVEWMRESRPFCRRRRVRCGSSGSISLRCGSTGACRQRAAETGQELPPDLDSPSSA